MHIGFQHLLLVSTGLQVYLVREHFIKNFHLIDDSDERVNNEYVETILYNSEDDITFYR